MIPAFDRTKLSTEGATKFGEDTGSIATAVANARNVKTVLPLGVARGIGGAVLGCEIELLRALTPLGKLGESAIISRRPGGYFITHVAGKKFPIVNGKPIGAEPFALDNLDQIEVGADKLQFYLK